jgi:hypothetical protein
MLFFPKGVFNGEVVDPDRLSVDFVEANRVLSNTTHYQWAEDTFDQRVKLEAGSHVNIINNTKHVRLQITSGQDPIVGRGIGTPAPDLWQIPLDRGLQEIGDGDIRADWVSDVPELVMICYTIQYYMPGQAIINSIFGGNNFRARFQSLIQLDGSNIPGTGPHATENTISGIRGVGFAHTSLGASATTIQFLEAGAHTATVVANIARTDPHIDSFNVDSYDYKIDNQDFAGFVIASRNLIVMRFGRGGLLGG